MYQYPYQANSQQYINNVNANNGTNSVQYSQMYWRINGVNTNNNRNGSTSLVPMPVPPPPTCPNIWNNMINTNSQSNMINTNNQSNMIHQSLPYISSSYQYDANNYYASAATVNNSSGSSGYNNSNFNMPTIEAASNDNR